MSNTKQKGEKHNNSNSIAQQRACAERTHAETHRVHTLVSLATVDLVGKISKYWQRDTVTSLPEHVLVLRAAAQTCNHAPGAARTRPPEQPPSLSDARYVDAHCQARCTSDAAYVDVGKAPTIETRSGENKSLTGAALICVRIAARSTSRSTIWAPTAAEHANSMHANSTRAYNIVLIAIAIRRVFSSCI